MLRGGEGRGCEAERRLVERAKFHARRAVYQQAINVFLNPIQRFSKWWFLGRVNWHPAVKHTYLLDQLVFLVVVGPSLIHGVEHEATVRAWKSRYPMLLILVHAQ